MSTQKQIAPKPTGLSRMHCYDKNSPCVLCADKFEFDASCIPYLQKIGWKVTGVAGMDAFGPTGYTFVATKDRAVRELFNLGFPLAKADANKFGLAKELEMAEARHANFLNRRKRIAERARGKLTHEEAVCFLDENKLRTVATNEIIGNGYFRKPV